MALVLMLNASFEPMRAITVARAIMRVHEGRANLIEGTGEFLRSPSVTVEMPAVIQLRDYVRVPVPRVPVYSRSGVLMRDRHTCAYCLDPADTIDHVTPQCRGGRDTWFNTVACCGPCNNRKGHTSLAELGWRLRHKPGLPPASMVPFLWLTATPPLWLPYVEPWWKRKEQAVLAPPVLRGQRLLSAG